MASSPERLYDPVILQHARAPARRGRLEAPTHRADGRNRPCGDTVSLELHADADVIVALRFEGEGCALCMAAASALCDALEGASLRSARQTLTALTDALTARSSTGADALPGDLGALTAVRDFPARHGCALLAAQILGRMIAP